MVFVKTDIQQYVTVYFCHFYMIKKISTIMMSQFNRFDDY